MVLGKFPVPGRPTRSMIEGQGPIALAVGAGGGCLDIFIFLYPFYPLSPFLWETARYRLKHCLKGPLKPKQPTSQLHSDSRSSLLSHLCPFRYLLIFKLTLRNACNSMLFSGLLVGWLFWA